MCVCVPGLCALGTGQWAVFQEMSVGSGICLLGALGRRAGDEGKRIGSDKGKGKGQGRESEEESQKEEGELWWPAWGSIDFGRKGSVCAGFFEMRGVSRGK